MAEWRTTSICLTRSSICSTTTQSCFRLYPNLVYFGSPNYKRLLLWTMEYQISFAKNHLRKVTEPYQRLLCIYICSVLLKPPNKVPTDFLFMHQLFFAIVSGSLTAKLEKPACLTFAPKCLLEETKLDPTQLSQRKKQRKRLRHVSLSLSVCRILSPNLKQFLTGLKHKSLPATSKKTSCLKMKTKKLKFS